MRKDIQPSWMLSPRSFIKLLGAEYDLMRDAGLLRRFYVSSLLIMVILIVTWVSIEYAMDLLFHTMIIEIALAIFFSLLFFCIYIFLLNTFAKENRVQKGALNASNIIRIGFVAFMGFLIAQPLVILLYTGTLSPTVKNYKRQLLEEHTTKINTLAKDELEKLAAQKQRYIYQKNEFDATLYDNELVKIDSIINNIQDKSTALQLAGRQTIDRNSFFIYRVQTVSRKYPSSWFLTLFIILVFLLPGYLVYTISSKNEYYQLKKAQEKELVLTAYRAFTIHYRTMFNEQVSIFSRYEDPPFNTIRKQPPIPASMTDFLQKYLDNG